jgi:hypothetical protein
MKRNADCFVNKKVLMVMGSVVVPLLKIVLYSIAQILREILSAICDSFPLLGMIIVVVIIIFAFDLY